MKIMAAKLGASVMIGYEIHRHDYGDGDDHQWQNVRWVGGGVESGRSILHLIPIISFDE